MGTQITITLPDEVYRRAEKFALLANRDLATVLADTISLSIPGVSSQAETLKPITELSDEEVMALTELQMEPEQDRCAMLTRERKLRQEIQLQGDW